MTRYMIRYFLFLIGAYTPLTLSAQAFPKAEQVELPIYEAPADFECLHLEMGYAKWNFLKAEKANEIRLEDVVAIDLVYTKYPKSLKEWEIQHDVLLEKRLHALAKIDSRLLDDTSILWRYVLQTDCESRGQAKELFHGFVVWMVPQETEKPLAAESSIKELSLPPHSSKNPPSMSRQGRIHLLKENPTMRSVLDWATQERVLKDSIVFSVLDRNPQWNNMLLVMDWTGSMYKYGASVLLWNRLNYERNAVKHYVLFNDGGSMSDNKKIIGRTGGILSMNPDSFEQVLFTMQEMEEAGTGGDVIENDIEAILYGLDSLSTINELILIADNNSNMRDMALLDKLEGYQQPVRVILCGIGDPSSLPYPNPQYLQLAYRTGGSLHTLEEDILSLKKLLEGEEIQIGWQTYRLEKGEFKPLKRM